jgi:hypothetical protein
MTCDQHHKSFWEAAQQFRAAGVSAELPWMNKNLQYPIAQYWPLGLPPQERAAIPQRTSSPAKFPRKPNP